MKRHCNLCDNQILSIDKGSICGVTNKKPNFNRTCIKASFKNKLKEELQNCILELEYIQHTKRKTHFNSFQGIVIGLLILIIGYFFITHFFDNNYGNSLYAIKYLPIALGLPIVVGYFFLKFSLSKLNHYKKEKRIALKQKQQIDKVLKLYNQKYRYQTHFEKEIHGIQEVEIDIELL